ncbi:TonB-dependent receptor [Gemmatimonadetes bacterium T265]|nr:TonB-dependent receptor [Gemmatimonadetes bacterium T265]
MSLARSAASSGAARRTPLLLVLAAAVPAAARAQTPASGRADSTARDSARARQLEGVTVRAVRSGAAPAQTTLDATAVARAYTGQDVPLVLQQAPSVTTYSESGSQNNYSYFRLRGIDQSRVNITLDGVPLNEPEDQQVYFSDFPDLASSLRSVQVQRGVGTSTFGQASFGGSVNLETVSLGATPRGGEVQLGGGSFGAARANASYTTGLLPSRFAFAGRFSNQKEDGYRRGSGHAGNSQYFSAGYFGERDLVKLTLLTGVESNGQAYEAVPLSVLRVDPRANPLAGVGDRFRESMAALSYTRLLSPSATLATTVYGFRAGGTYDYPSDSVHAPYRYGLQSRWGGIITALHAVRGAATLDVGAHANDYSRDHTFADRPDLDAPAYANRGYKAEQSAFGKLAYALRDATLFGDLQLRQAAFRYRPTAGSGVPDASAAWRFANPRVGAAYRAAPTLTLTASYGASGREPTRADLLAGADDVSPQDVDSLLPLTRVRPERVRDFEGGADVRTGALSLHLGGYVMRFRDEIALTGRTTPLGYDIRTNVPSSVRRGVELEGRYAITSALAVGGSFARSYNRIARYDDDATGTNYLNVPPTLTPDVVSVQQFTWRATSWLVLTGDGRYQGRTYLAPVGDARLTTPPFFVVAGGARFQIRGRELLVEGRNLLDRRAYPSGDVSGDGVARYYVLAPRNVVATLRLGFGR